MEKRLFLAIGLSLMIVWLWSSIAPKPDINQKNLKIDQELKSDDTADSKKSEAFLPLANELSSEAENSTKAIKPRIEVLKSDKLTAEFSNIGASLNLVTINEYDASLPLKKITSLAEYDTVPFILDRANGNTISYSYENNDIKITKSYHIHDDDYVIESEIELYNKSSMSKQIKATFLGYMVEMSNLNDDKQEKNYMKSRDKSLLEYVISSENGMHRKAGAFKFSSKERKQEFGKILWAGFRDRYFCALIRPKFDAIGYSIDPISESQLKVEIEAKESVIQPQASINLDTFIYVGPEKINELKEYGFGFEKIKLR